MVIQTRLVGFYEIQYDPWRPALKIRILNSSTLFITQTGHCRFSLGKALYIQCPVPQNRYGFPIIYSQAVYFAALIQNMQYMT